MSAPQPGTPRTIYVQWSVDGNHIRKWSWSEFDLAERLNAETVSVSDPKAQALADALRAIIHGSTANGLDSFRRPIASVLSQNIADAQDSLADWEGK